jgi:protein-S-isoprenylcysteine O-methyltransferase Ste14
MLWVYLSKPYGSGFFEFRTGINAVAGCCLIVLGFALFVWSARNLAHGVTINASEPSTLVVSGPYRHVRHPLYVAVALVFIGVWVFYGRWALTDIGFLLLAALLAHIAVVRYEEIATRKRVGRAYDLYCARVPRWLPRLSPAIVDDLNDHAEEAAQQTAQNATHPKGRAV